ncbi:MAG: hypothetical protein CSA62_02440 [Planctomycetota bacterium]|nr:MAG: hypothetical protein CSA62_02440 [Planctomycetota bacterium]
MKDFLTGVGLATAGLAVFSGSVVGILALQGRLDSARLGFKPEAKSEAKAGDVNAVDASFQAEGEEGPAKAGALEPERGSRAAKPESGLAETGKGKSLFELPFKAPMTKEEIVRIAFATQKQQRLVAQERAALRQRRYEQQLREEDLLTRSKSVEKMMREVEKAKADLAARYLRFQKEITRLDLAEKRNIKKQAENLQAQDPLVAADTLLKYIPEREDLAVKLLVSMESESAAKVLAKMDREQAAHLIERATRVIETEQGR